MKATLTYPDAKRVYAGHRAAIVARLAEIPRLRKALADLRAIISTHRAAIIAEEDRTGPKLVAIAAQVEGYLTSVEQLGREIVNADHRFQQLETEHDHGLGQLQLLAWPVLLALTALVGVIGGGYYLVTTARDRARIDLAKNINDLQARGADPQVLKALTGVYDGLGGQTAQVGDTLVKVATWGGILFGGYKLVQALGHRRRTA